MAILSKQPWILLRIVSLRRPTHSRIIPRWSFCSCSHFPSTCLTSYISQDAFGLWNNPRLNHDWKVFSCCSSAFWSISRKNSSPLHSSVLNFSAASKYLNMTVIHRILPDLFLAVLKWFRMDFEQTEQEFRSPAGLVSQSQLTSHRVCAARGWKTYAEIWPRREQ